MSPFPVTESTLSAAHLGRLLQQAYALSANTTCKLFRTGMNHLYMVTDGDKKFVFRIYTYQWRSLGDISEEIRLLLHLHHHGVHVAYPLPASAGNYIQHINAPEGERHAVLFSYARGEKSALFSETVAYSIGAAMAHMHNASQDFTTPRVTYTPQVLLTNSFQQTSAFFTKPSEEMDFVARAGKFLAREYDKVDTTTVRSGSIHLDIWFDNMHFDGDEVTIFDFDFCGNGWLCHDIGYFMYQLYSTNPVEKDYELKLASFLKGYESVTPISKEEMRIIPFVSTAIILFYLGIQCDRYDTWSNIFLNEDHLKRFTAQIKRWLMYNGITI